MKNNLISVSQFFQTNNCSVEFFPFSFLVKDLSTGAPLVKGLSKGNLYELPSQLPISSTTAVTNLTTKASADTWHRRLGHPFSKTLSHLFHLFKLSFENPNKLSVCDSCHCHKSHKLPFNKNSLSSSKPLELLYTNVWGPAHIPLSMVSDTMSST